MDSAFEAPRFRPPSFDLDLQKKNPLDDTDFIRVGTLTYIWLYGGDNFWFLPTRIDGQLFSGFREMYSEWVFVSFLACEVEGFF
ncbi:MAG: hypothetical protein FWE20_04845 [Defluviitaleaceae bacterium]|nr:hypothetical protein [Defluviitaleaceae bacterium]